MNKSKKLLKQARDNRLKNANKIPKKLTVKIRVYNRNSDVLAAVLERANGKCELCSEEEPFIRVSGWTPYLEVHHVVQSVKDGEDTW